MKIGEIMALDREITLNEGKESRTLGSGQYRRPSRTGGISLPLF